jgi:hypothetical protein
MTTKEKISETIKEGNKYLLYFLFIFVFIHFVNIIPFKHPIENNMIGQTTKTIENQISYLNSAITKLENNNIETNKIESFKDVDDNNIQIDESLKHYNDSVRQEKIYSLREKIVQYQKNSIDISKQKVVRSFSIPILGISIDETVILSVYPAFILVGLCLALIYRRRLLFYVSESNADEVKELDFPIWAAPLPYGLRPHSISSWFFVNTIGLTIHGLIIYVGLDFLFFRGNKYDFETLAVIVLITIIAAVVYLITIIQLIIIEWKGIKE